MKIEVIMDGARKGWTATRIDIRDLFNFYETMEDWPVDHEGPFTLDRASKVITKHARHSRLAHAPITPESEFNCVWAVRNADGEWIGYWRDKIKGGKIHTGQAAIHPAKRGNGYYRTIMHMQVFAGFYVFEADEWTFEVANANPAVQVKVDRYLDDNKVAERDSTSTGAHVVMYHQTRQENIDQFARVINDADNADGIRVSPNEPGYRNVFTFTM
jgi:hypothetical protein